MEGPDSRWDKHQQHLLQSSCSEALCHAQDEQPLSALIALTQHLEGARFPDYWQTADSCKSILGSVPGYYDAIRKYILYVISVTCQKVTSSLLAESLRLDEAGVDALVGPQALHSALLAVRCKPGSLLLQKAGTAALGKSSRCLGRPILVQMLSLRTDQ